jgi:hypothetical protein
MSDKAPDMDPAAEGMGAEENDALVEKQPSEKAASDAQTSPSK